MLLSHTDGLHSDATIDLVLNPYVLASLSEREGKHTAAAYPTGESDEIERYSPDISSPDEEEVARAATSDATPSLPGEEPAARQLLDSLEQTGSPDATACTLPPPDPGHVKLAIQRESCTPGRRRLFGLTSWFSRRAESQHL